MGFSRQEYLPFPSPVDHILSGLSNMTRPSWVALQAWPGFIELDKAVVLVWFDWLVFCEYGFSVAAFWWPLATLTILLGFLLTWRGVMEFHLSCFKSWKMMLWKCCTQYASKFGKLSSGHRTRKGLFSFQSHGKAVPKNAQTTAQLYSSHMLVK